MMGKRSQVLCGRHNKAVLTRKSLNIRSVFCPKPASKHLNARVRLSFVVGCKKTKQNAAQHSHTLTEVICNCNVIQNTQTCHQPTCNGSHCSILSVAWQAWNPGRDCQ